MKSALKRRSTRIVAALTVLVLLGCSPLRCGYSTDTTALVAGRGCHDLMWFPSGTPIFAPPSGFFFLPPSGFFTDHGLPFLPHEIAALFPRMYRDRPGWHLVVPLHLPALLLLASLVWLTRKTSLPGHCRKCGYDLTGNVSGRCPECGAEIAGGQST